MNSRHCRRSTKKHGLDVKIDAFRGTYAGENSGDIAVQILLANLAALATMEDMTRTQPDLVAEMKKIAGMQKLIFDGIFDGIYDKLTP